MSQGELGLPVSEASVLIEVSVGRTLDPVDFDEGSHEIFADFQMVESACANSETGVPTVTETVGKTGLPPWLIREVLITNNNGATRDGVDGLPLAKRESNGVANSADFATIGVFDPCTMGEVFDDLEV